MSKKRGQFEELLCRNRKVTLHVCMMYSCDSIVAVSKLPTKKGGKYV